MISEQELDELTDKDSELAMLVHRIGDELFGNAWNQTHWKTEANRKLVESDAFQIELVKRRLTQ